MANGNNPRSKSTKSKPNFNDFQFCDIRLTKDDKPAFLKWSQEHVQDAFDLLDSLVNSGVKASYAWSDHNDCYSFSLTQLDEKSPNAHVVLVSRADNFQEGLMLGLYKHYVLCPDGLWPVGTQENNWG